MVAAAALSSAACLAARDDWSLSVSNDSGETVIIRLAGYGRTTSFVVGPNSGALIGTFDAPAAATVSVLNALNCRVLAPPQYAPEVGDVWVIVGFDLLVDVSRHDGSRAFGVAEASDSCPEPNASSLSPTMPTALDSPSRRPPVTIAGRRRSDTSAEPLFAGPGPARGHLQGREQRQSSARL